jgi:hypothetical protein
MCPFMLDLYNVVQTQTLTRPKCMRDNNNYFILENLIAITIVYLQYGCQKSWQTQNDNFEIL